MITQIGTISKIQMHLRITQRGYSNAVEEKIGFTIGKISSIHKTISRFKETILEENLKEEAFFVTFAEKEIQINETIKQTCTAHHVIRTHIVF